MDGDQTAHGRESVLATTHKTNVEPTCPHPTLSRKRRGETTKRRPYSHLPSRPLLFSTRRRRGEKPPMAERPADITELLNAAQSGDSDAQETAYALVYDEL